MRARPVLGKSFLILVVGLLLVLPVFAQEPVGIQDIRTIEPWMPVYVPDEVIVKFKPGTVRPMGLTVARGVRASLQETGYKGEFQVYKVAPGTVEQAIRSLRRQPGILYAEPNYIYYAFAFPNDRYFPYQWNLFNWGKPSGNTTSNYGVQAETAWSQGFNGAGIKVAVVDTGVAYENYGSFKPAPDLSGTSFAPGYDFVNNDSHPNDDQAHGTHVTGTIAQTTNNDVSGADQGFGVAGIAHGATIMPVKVLSSNGSGTSTQIANGIRWAADNGARIINLSLGSFFGNTTMQNAIKYAYTTKGVLVVAASGNNGFPWVSYPAAYAECIAVGAIRFDGLRAGYSNYGSALDLVAPGGDNNYDMNGDGIPDGIIQQTFSAPNYGTFGYWLYSGTSMASPHVVGVAALVLDKNPNLTAAQVRTILQNSAKNLGAAGWDKYYGYGLVNATGALAATP